MSMRSLPSAVPSKNVFLKSSAPMEGCDGRLDHGRGDIPRGRTQENAVDGARRRRRLPYPVRYGPPFSGKRFCRARHELSLAAGNLLHHGDYGPLCRRPARGAHDYSYLYRHTRRASQALAYSFNSAQAEMRLIAQCFSRIPTTGSANLQIVPLLSYFQVRWV